MDHRRRIGASLLLAGGLLETARLAVLMTIAGIVLPEPTGTASYAIPSVLIGGGLIALGWTCRGVQRVTILVAGCLELLVVVVNVAQIATHSVLGPAPSQLAFGLSWIAVVVAAVLVLLTNGSRGPARWALSVPAGCIVLMMISYFALPVPVVTLLPPLGFAVAGGLLLQPRTRTRPIRPAHSG